jgi:hypothetical protein
MSGEKIDGAWRAGHVFYRTTHHPTDTTVCSNEADCVCVCGKQILSQTNNLLHASLGSISENALGARIHRQ